MKRTLGGHMLNTETAKLLAVSFDQTQRLYKTRGGVYFLHTASGEAEDLMILSPQKVRCWAEGHISTEEYLTLFRMPEDTEIRFCLTPEAMKALKREQERSNRSMQQIINDLILVYF